jgi:DNA repair photolyase
MLERFIGGYLFHPGALDYSGDTCRNSCAYCFANINQGNREGNLSGAIRRFYKKEIITYDDMLLKEGYPIVVSNRTDPFTPRNYRDTLALFTHLRNIPNGIFIQTKCGPGMDEALDILEDKKPVVYITVTTIRDEIAKVIEPGAPLPLERLRIAKDLHKRGYLVLVAVNPCCEQWMPTKDLQALCNELKKSGMKHICIEILDISRNRLKVLSQSRKDRIGEAALTDCASGRVRQYVRDCTQYLIGAGMIVAKRGMPFKSTFFDDIKARLGKVMPTYQDFTNHCLDKHPDGSPVTFAEFEKVICSGGGIFRKTIRQNTIRDYLLRSGFTSWKDNQEIHSHRELLRVLWNDPRPRISIQKHCLIRPTNKKDDEGNIILYFDKVPNLGKKKGVIEL